MFGFPNTHISVLIHPQSIVHSMVEYIDGTVMAQMAVPDMRLAIQYALGYPDRLARSIERLDFANMASLTFFQTRMSNLLFGSPMLRSPGQTRCLSYTMRPTKLQWRCLCSTGSVSWISSALWSTLWKKRPVPRFARCRMLCRLTAKPGSELPICLGKERKDESWKACFRRYCPLSPLCCC